ncbi:MAG: GNAT family N-acetyltransferase [Candidatus Jidaibacter sp.]|nr:GNAT family N-acetyltransferase [Candidatus Jidaibacter sp.]
MTITFEPLHESHFPLLLKWLETPHVKKWWDQDVTYTMELVKEKFGKHIHGLALSKNANYKTYSYVICLEEEMIGYIQAYNAHDFAQENHLDLSAISGSVCGVDLFIGELPFLHKGWGKRILNEFEEQILAPRFDWCLIDPAKDNLVAIKAFTKAGFKIFKQFETESNIWMLKDLSSSIAFSYDPDSSFDEKISCALRRQCQDFTGIKTDFEQVNIYLKHNDINMAGAICYIHGKILWCDSIYVEEAFQNKGFGRQLIAKLFDIAITRNLREVQLNTYFPKAHMFFKKSGFEEVAVIPNWKYNLTCYLMRKMI